MLVTLDSKMAIQGSLSRLLLGLNNVDKQILSNGLIGKPINDANGKQIGTITSVDFETDIWYGQIERPAIGPSFLSLEVRRKK